MPTMATAQMLTREAGVIAATASALASAPDEGERARLMETLSARAARLDRLLDDMRALGSDSRAIDEIQELAGRLTRTLDRQDMLVHRRLATRAELVRTIELLGRAHREF